MKERKKFLHVLLCFLLLIGLMHNTALKVDAKHERKEAKRAISIVFDNSGSMYLGDIDHCKAWCRATYGMEVFAAMMNPGDILEIYPMAPIEVRGKTYSDAFPLVIDSEDKVSMIRDIFTPIPMDTPIETITSAYKGLVKYKDMEQWLIVLTDGAEFYENNGIIDDTKTALSNKLSEYNQKVNVMYLGIGPSAVEPAIGGSLFHVSKKASNTGDVLADLTSMCNTIFGRDALPNVGTSVDFDLPMNKLIIFAQGKDVADITLKNTSGDSYTPVKEYAPHFSEIGTDYIDPCIVDDSLQGVIATYKDCPAGSYSIGLVGTVSDISVYYEPDVDLVVLLTDENGNPAPDELHSGTYYINYGIVDDKGDAITSPLLGKTEYEIIYTINGKKETVNTSESGKTKVTLSAGDTLNVHADVTYLNGYHIECDGKDLGWPDDGYTVVPKPAGKLELKLDKDPGKIKLSELEQKGVFDFSLIYEDETLAGKGLDSADIKFAIEGGKLCVKKEKSAGGFRLKLNYDGSAEKTKCGDFNLKVTATYINEDGQTATSNELSVPVKLEDDRYHLKMDLKAPQKFYQISKISIGKPIQANITKGQNPLTDEELNDITFNVDSNGLPVLVSPMPGKSAFQIRLDPNGKYEQGSYIITCKASLTDVFGKEQEVEESQKIKLKNYPAWLPPLLALLVIIFLIIIISLYLNAKILPKKISAENIKFKVDGKDVGGQVNLTYEGGNKRSGSLKLNIPRVADKPALMAGFVLTLSAASPRKTKSSNRDAKVDLVKPIQELNIKNIKIVNISLQKDKNNRLKRVDDFVDAEISDGDQCTISGENGQTHFRFTCTLQFK